MLIEEKINKIKEDFSFFENWEDKYQYLIDLGKKLPVLESQYKNMSLGFKVALLIFGLCLNITITGSHF